MRQPASGYIVRLPNLDLTSIKVAYAVPKYNGKGVGNRSFLLARRTVGRVRAKDFVAFATFVFCNESTI